MPNRMRRIFLDLYQIICKMFITPILLHEQRKPPFKNPNERPIEYGFALNCIAKIYPKEILDVGSGRSSWPHILANCGFHVTAIDEKKAYWKEVFFNRHYYILNENIMKPNINIRFDLITCISVLEHIPDHNKAIRGMFKLLKPGGYAIFTFPYNKDHYIENVYKLSQARYGQKYKHVCQIYSKNEIDSWLNENGGTIIDQEFYKIFTGEFWTFGDRIYPPLNVGPNDKCHLACFLIQKKKEGDI